MVPADDLFADTSRRLPPGAPPGAPLAERMRPRDLDEVVGCESLIGPGTTLRRAVDAGRLPSLILWGPPGCGKTTVARALARAAEADFREVSAVSSGVKTLREVIDVGKANRLRERRTVLFIDEIHRFNKSQQDAVLPAVEDGTVILVGATTENPAFEVNAPLRSRCHVLRLEPVPADVILRLVDRALEDPGRGLAADGVTLSAEAREELVRRSNGDARIALNLLEACASALPEGEKE
ncbi:MAG: AAA family ATPase, partial [Gemmatimonadetes bacterium]|nr:AAA family ATPase [Gemmatimonadota bacterium]